MERMANLRGERERSEVLKLLTSERSKNETSLELQVFEAKQ
jgi:hypothetical protein